MKTYTVMECEYRRGERGYEWDISNYSLHTIVNGRKEAAEVMGLTKHSVDKSLSYDRPVFNIRDYHYYWVKY